MITPAYCTQMVAYNAWQNDQLKPLLAALPVVELTRNRGAFFGSIFETVNHLLWADLMWLHRFGAGEEPSVPPERHKELTPDLAAWTVLRDETDARIVDWFANISQEMLDGQLHWHSKLSDKSMVSSTSECVVHFFNHQTHHRGQIHAMLTAAGSTAPVSDLLFMPEVK